MRLGILLNHKKMLALIMPNTHDKTPILFVHGAWHGAWCWEKYFFKLFEDSGYECYAFDLPKHDKPGKIKGINSLSINDYVNALKVEVKKLGKLPIIIGHSMGGIILQKYLETESCAKAVLMASVPPQGVLRTTFNFLKKSYAYPSLLTMNLYRLVNSKDKAGWAFFSEDLPKSELEEYTNKLCSESYRVFIEMLFPNVKVKHHTEIPMLVIGAENDNIFTVDENKSTARKFGAELIILNDIAHDMMLDPNHKKAAKTIIDWLEKSELQS